MSTNFDRVRPRAPRPVGGPPAAAAPDSEGKRALFSSAADPIVPRFGTALIECSRCDQRSVLGPSQALRAAFPSLHLGLRVGHGEGVKVISVAKHDYPTYMRCPACGRPSWVRLTIQL